jgi:hypothetical protein
MFIRGVRDARFSRWPVRVRRPVRPRLAALAARPMSEPAFTSWRQTVAQMSPSGALPAAIQRLRRPMLKLAAPALMGFVLAMPTVAAASPPPLLGQLEGQAWSQLLATPADQYPLADPCLKLGGGVVAPFGHRTCVVQPGTKIMVFGYEAECDNAQPPPFYGATYADQVAACRAQLSGVTARFTVDGRAIPTVEATSPPEAIILPPNNINQVPPGPITFAVDGLVALEHPLPPGTHTFKSHFKVRQPGGPPQSFDESFQVRVVPAP